MFRKKIWFCILGIVVLILILSTYFVKTTYKHPKGEYIENSIVKQEMTTIGIINEDMISLNQLLDEDTFLQEGKLRFDDFYKIENELQINSDTITDKKYQKDSYILGEDWNVYFKLVIDKYGQEKIVKEDVCFITKGENVKDKEGIVQSNNFILTDKGMYQYKIEKFTSYIGNEVTIIQYENNILDIDNIVQNNIFLANIYVMDEKEGFTFFWNNYEIRLPATKKYSCEDMIADITLDESGIMDINRKQDRVGGKLLRITDEEIEIENSGIFKISENMQIYQLYGKLSNKEVGDLRIGYSFSDYVIEDGKVEACLIMKEEDMDTIRVLIKNSNYEGRIHESVSFTCDTGYTVCLLSNSKEETVAKNAGEVMVIESKDLKLENERMKVIPDALSGNISITSIKRAQGTPVYRGSLEIEKQDEGLLVINEVLLEEYLYKVVPSEMPASYPFDALKAQAICARTYAYGKMIHAGLAPYGAHVDDSAGFQVYNNIAMQSATTRAVKETLGEVLWYEDSPIGAYYYSTSCGAGTDTSVWNGYGGDSPDYLQPQMINKDKEKEKAEELKNEENFREFIVGSDEDYFEKEEGWFRWTYEAEEFDEEHLLEILQKRYDSNSNLILTKDSSGDFTSIPIKKIGKIKDISIIKRNAGGVADELLITGDKATVKVVSELNIRYVLTDGISKVVRQSGDEVRTDTLLPSGYFVIDTSKEKGYVVGYKLIGGGFGHGVGMSQNAAKEMSKAGMNYQDILIFFYENSYIKTIQTREE